MHIAPWTKASISKCSPSGVSLSMILRISAISSSESSLAQTTRFAPICLQKRKVPAFVLFACVEI